MAHLPYTPPQRGGRGTGATETPIAACSSCRRPVRIDDDFVRLRDALYHLSCMLTALRQLGHETASMPAKEVSEGIAALQNGQSSGR